MTRFRAGAATCLIAAVLVGSLAAVVLEREMWPFSHYPMYSQPRTERVDVRYVQGRGSGDWFDLTERHVAPFKRSILLTTFRRSKGRAATETTLYAVARHYDIRRRTGQHDGPRLAAIRLIELSWDRFDAQRPDEPPDTTRVVAALPAARSRR